MGTFLIAVSVTLGLAAARMVVALLMDSRAQQPVWVVLLVLAGAAVTLAAGIRRQRY